MRRNNATLRSKRHEINSKCPREQSHGQDKEGEENPSLSSLFVSPIYSFCWEMMRSNLVVSSCGFDEERCVVLRTVGIKEITLFRRMRRCGAGGPDETFDGSTVLFFIFFLNKLLC